MTGEMRTYDEIFTTTAGSAYGFRLAQGTHGFSTTTNPFAAKSTQGDRSYSDYDALQAVAISDFSGGFGQDRMENPARYWNAINVDTRSEKIVLGPQVTYNAEAATLSCGDALASSGKYLGTTPSTSWEAIYAPTRQKVAVFFDCPPDFAQIDRVWLPLRISTQAAGVQVALHNNSASADGIGVPGTLMSSVTLGRELLSRKGAWTECAFPSGVSVAPGSRYWIVISTTETDAGAVGWYSIPSLGANAKYDDGSGWKALGNHLIFWYDDAFLRPDSPLSLLIGAGEDGIMRLWGYHGRKLYYVNANGQPVPVQNGMGSVFEAVADIQDAVWFRGTSDSHPYLYCALGDDMDMIKFDGNIGAEQWFTVTGLQAHALAVHEDKLWLADSSHQIDYSITGATTSGTWKAVGAATTPIRKMVSWNGALMIGKDDGLYKAYFEGGTLIVQQLIDLTALRDVNNFRFMIDHHGDLVFPIGLGIARYTIGGVFTSFAAESGEGIAVSERGYYRAAVSTVGALFCVVEGPLSGYSSLLAYVEGGWHPIATAARLGDPLRALAVDPGFYGDLPRLWYSDGLQIAYVEMPMITQRRWTYRAPGWAAEGVWESSWFDGNLRTVAKDWMHVELDVEHAAVGGPQVVVEYRMMEGDAWSPLGMVAQNGITTLDFPSNTYSNKLQLRLILQRGVYDGVQDTPRVNAIVIKYLERPDVIHTYLRTYVLSPRQETRGGGIVTTEIAEQIAWLRTLASEKEPLIWTPWYGGPTRRVHILRYNATERREEIGLQDHGSVIVAVQLQEV